MARVEDTHQKAYMTWFKTQFPALKEDIHHFANERECSGRFGKHLQDMGVLSGVSDIFLGIPNNGYAGLWIELKVLNGRLMPNQHNFLRRKSARGYYAIAAWGWENAKEVTLKYLDGFNCKSEIELQEIEMIK